MEHQYSRCRQCRTGTQVRRVRDTPQDLSHGLWVSGNANNSRGGVQMQLRWLNGGDFEQIERAGIKKQKGHKVGAPECRVNEGGGFRITGQLPQCRTFVRVIDKVTDAGQCQWETDHRKQDPPCAGTDDGFRVRAETRQAGMGNSKDRQQAGHGRSRIRGLQCGLDRLDKDVTAVEGSKNPDPRHRSQDGTRGEGKFDPVG